MQRHKARGRDMNRQREETRKVLRRVRELPRCKPRLEGLERHSGHLLFREICPSFPEGPSNSRLELCLRGITVGCKYELVKKLCVPADSFRYSLQLRVEQQSEGSYFSCSGRRRLARFAESQCTQRCTASWLLMRVAFSAGAELERSVFRLLWHALRHLFIQLLKNIVSRLFLNRALGIA